MRKFGIKLTREDTRTTNLVEGEFEDNEVMRLQNFFKYAKALAELSILQSGNFGQMSIKQEAGQPPSFAISLPPMEAIAALLHKLRRFILHKEPTSFNSIAGLIKRRFRDPVIHSVIDSHRRIFESRELQSHMTISVNGLIVNSEEMLKNWLNAVGEYHEDVDKRKEIEKIKELMPDDATQFIMLMVLSDQVRAIVSLAHFVGLLFGDVKTFETHLSKASA